MALQDLTPQLRTRLSRMERAVGWFVFLATALLLFGFGYYIYNAAKTRGWFDIKAPFHTFVGSSAGLSVGDSVVMLGYSVGTITRLIPPPPKDARGVRVEFEIRDPYFRWIQQYGSVVKVNSSGFLDKRQLEVTRGTNGYAWCVTQPVFDKPFAELKSLVASDPGHWQLAQDVLDANSNIVFSAYTVLNASNLDAIAPLVAPSNTICVYDNTINKSHVVASWHERTHRYVDFTPDKDSAWLKPVEAIGVGDRLGDVVAQVQSALPNFLALTNQLTRILNNAADATSNLNATLADVRPAMTNIVQLTALMRQPGGVGMMALGANGPAQLQGMLTNVDNLLVNTDTNLDTLMASVGESLDHLADITSNLNAQVQANTNMLTGIAKTIGDADDLIQGLKRHWLLRSAFKHKATNNVAH